MNLDLGYKAFGCNNGMQGLSLSIFGFVKHVLTFKTYLGGGLAPSSQTVGFLLIPQAGKSDR